MSSVIFWVRRGYVFCADRYDLVVVVARHGRVLVVRNLGRAVPRAELGPPLLLVLELCDLGELEEVVDGLDAGLAEDESDHIRALVEVEDGGLDLIARGDPPRVVPADLLVEVSELREEVVDEHGVEGVDDLGERGVRVDGRARSS